MRSDRRSSKRKGKKKDRKLTLVFKRHRQALKPEGEEHLVGLVEELSCDAIQITQGALCSLAWLLLEALKNGKKRQHLSRYDP